MNVIRIISLLLVFLFSGTALAQQQVCNKREKFAEQLTKGKFKEAPRIIGVIGEHQILEIWENADTGSWTALITNANGTSCMVAAGEAFIILPITKPEAPSILH